MLPDPERFAVAFAMPDGKESRALKDLKKISTRQRRVIAQFTLRFKRLAEGLERDGKLSTSQFEWLRSGEEIFEIKVNCDEGPFRCFGFLEGNTYWLTHCCKKSDSDQWYAEQGRVAGEIRARHRIARAKLEQS